ncbi:MAG: GTPase [Planctomycetota bacterium]
MPIGCNRRSSASGGGDEPRRGTSGTPATIAAISSPPGPGRRGVLRVSGPAAGELVAAVFRPAGEGRTPPRRGVRAGRFDDGRGGQPALLLWMPAPRSYTREDVAEFHLPGASPLLAAALARLLARGAVPATAGEFTRRAFRNGRLDLTRAEGVLELIAASDEAERRAAAGLLAGGLAARVEELRAGLAELRALVEASLDFDETDSAHVPAAELVLRSAAAAEALAGARGWEVRRQAPRALPRVLLWGPPNAGKSALFNALARPPVGALVSEHAGTTRDPLAAVWELPRMTCLLLDSPGLDDRARGVEAAAQALARREREAAALLLWVTPLGDPSAPAGPPGPGPLSPVLGVRSKADLAPGAEVPPGAVATSALRGTGLARLARAVERVLSRPDPGAAEGAGCARELFARHHRALEEAAEALERARGLLVEGAPLDLAAATLREATDALDGISGHTSPEDVLDRIFARFCIGK